MTRLRSRENAPDVEAAACAVVRLHATGIDDAELLLEAIGLRPYPATARVRPSQTAEYRREYEAARKAERPPRDSYAAPTRRPACGTTTGYRAHYKHGETACEPCRGAQAVYRRGLYRRDHPEARERRLVAVCGTESGYRAHVRRGEPGCEECLVAVRAGQKRRKQRARDRAREWREQAAVAAQSRGDQK